MKKRGVTMSNNLPTNTLSGLFLALLKETEIGSQQKADEALKKAQQYTDEELSKINIDVDSIGAETPKGAQAKVDAHASDTNKHITITERANWNAKETPTAAKQKADEALKDANRYTDQKIARVSVSGLGGETPQGAQEKVDSHANRRDNPHGITKAQLGLGNVDNVKQASKAELFEHMADGVKHTTQAEKNVWNAKETPQGAQTKADEALALAKTFTNVVAGNTLAESKMYTDTGLANLVDAAPGTLDTLYELAAALGNDPDFATTVTNLVATKATKIEFDAHVADVGNPHAVTKTQVGLSNVDNIKQAAKADFDIHDADSTRHITAIERNSWNSKAEGIHTHPISDVVELQTELDKKDSITSVDAKIIAAKNEAKTYTDTHDSNAIKHITAQERTDWNAKETPVGAQAKVNGLEDKLKALGFSDKSKPTSVALDDLKTAGFYYTENSVGTPVVSNGYLHVQKYSETYVHQTFITADTATVYNRVLSASVWKPWNKIETDSSSTSKNSQTLSIAKSYTDTVANTKVDKVTGKGLSTEDYTTAEKTKLSGIDMEANRYIHPATHDASMIVQDPERRMVSDIQIADFNSKETPAGAQTKVTKALNDSKAYADLQDSRFVHNESMKIFNKPAILHQNTSSVPGSLVIKAPFGFKNTMVSMRLFGYNYTETVTNLDLTLSFYSYSTGVYLQSGYINRGDFKVSNVRGAKDAAGNLVIVIDIPTASWAYPKIWMEQLLLTYSQIADSDGVGWTMTVEQDLTPYTFLKTFPGTESESVAGADAKLTAHANDAVKHITTVERNNWNAKETPAGAKVKADTALADSKTYTDAEVAKVSPTSIGAETPAGAQAKVDAHNADKANPHAVTKTQVGLSNVDNVKQATKAEFDTHNTDATRHLTAAERTLWNSKAEGVHIHPISGVTGLQAALDAKETPAGAQTKATKALTDSKVYTDGQISTLIGTAPGTLDTLYELADALGNDPNFATTVATNIGKKAEKTVVDSHITDNANPHGVTKAQVGLANVDNAKQATKTEFDAHTVDIVKHITAAERLSWNAKAGGAHTHAVGEITGLQAVLDAKETPAGAQTKATTSENNAKTHATNLYGNRIIDNRSVVPTPKSYDANRTTQEFKQATVMGLTGLATGTYVHVFTERAWADNSGGYVRQLAYDGNSNSIFTRNGNQVTDTWSAWDQLETASDAQAKVDNHNANKANPHAVTKAQVGLGSVDNVKQATKAEFDTHAIDAVKHITAAERTAWNGKAAAVHTHTTAQVTGLDAALASKETPAGAQTKATTAKNEAMAVSVSKAGDTMTGELKMENKVTFKSKFSIDYNATENSLDFIFVG